MKTKYLEVCVLLTATTFLCGYVIESSGQISYQPPVVALQPELVVVAETPVPQSYAWDGAENIGIVGGQYYYLGLGNVWIVCEPYRLERFHGWERHHPD